MKDTYTIDDINRMVIRPHLSSYALFYPPAFTYEGMGKAEVLYEGEAEECKEYKDMLYDLLKEKDDKVLKI